MSSLLSEPAVHAWALSCIVVALKTISAGVYTSTIRIRKGVYISPEDYEVQGVTPVAGLDPEVERARRIHQNDLESGLPFALIGFVYALTGPSSVATAICFAGFPIARILHGVFYGRALMPHRTIAFGLGFLILLWMAIASLIALL
jgi:uncharacterized MAPEG superfamily protein